MIYDCAICRKPSALPEHPACAFRLRGGKPRTRPLSFGGVMGTPGQTSLSPEAASRIMAAAVEPDLFSDDENVRHRAASPNQWEYAQAKVVAKMKVAYTALVAAVKG